MFPTVTRMPFMRGLAKYEVLFSSTTSKWFQILRNSSSGLKEFALHKGDTKETPVEMTFSGFLQHKRDQARRSIVFQIDSVKKWHAVFDFCNSIGEVNKLFHYSTNEGNFVLVEMRSKKELIQIVEKACANQNVIHHFALFDTSNLKYLNVVDPSDILKVKLNIPLKVKLEEILKFTSNLKCSLSDKISKLSERLKIDDFCMRLRFITCLQVECLFGGLMRNSTVYPFGSSVTGFGFKGCDLDLVILEESMDSEDKPQCLYFPVKHTIIDRRLMQSHLEVLSNLIDNFLVGCRNVNYIKFARVPIVKFQHYFSSLDCDLSLYMPGGVVMTQLLYNLSSIDDRVRPLVSAIRVWAKKLSLTSKQPGPYITNFSFTLLVIFFLQQKINGKGTVLPSLSTFPIREKSLLTVNEELSAINNFKMVSKINNSSLEELLLLFFTYYSSFDFSAYGCCVSTGKIVANGDRYPLFIKNPLDPTQNVSKNVNSSQVLRFQSCATCAKEILSKKNSDMTHGNSTFYALFSANSYKSCTNNIIKKQSKVSIHDILNT